jgi:response regulator RpfG family c-di-GMP phosphodiesterase
MDNVTGSEKNSRYGLAWKTNNKVAKEKKLDLKKTLKKCVLVTDNSEKKLNNLSNILKKYNYEVAITQNKEKALKIFRKKQYDFLISVIPGMVGVNFLGNIKALAPETEVLIVTGLELLESSLERITSGAFAYQNKLNKTQIFDKKNIKDFLHNEFRLLAAMDYYLERYSF